jgi:hypothetical protein
VRSDYLSLVLTTYMRSPSFDGQVGDRWYFDDEYMSVAHTTIDAAFRQYGIEAEPDFCEDVFAEIFSKLVDENGVVFDGDELSGKWFQFNVANKNQAIANIAKSNPVKARVERIGRPALERALFNIFENRAAENPSDLEQDDLTSNIEIPASDRIVSLNHNQIVSADAPITELIEALESDNGNPDTPGLRERLIGQIRAARELLRVGEYRAYLMYELLVRALGEIVLRYGNPTISALANALLGAVVSELVQA